jgi:hypothetical protein
MRVETQSPEIILQYQSMVADYLPASLSPAAISAPAETPAKP